MLYCIVLYSIVLPFCIMLLCCAIVSCVLHLVLCYICCMYVACYTFSVALCMLIPSTPKGLDGLEWVPLKGLQMLEGLK